MILGAFGYNLAYGKVAEELDPEQLAELRTWSRNPGSSVTAWRPKPTAKPPNTLSLDLNPASARAEFVVCLQ